MSAFRACSAARRAAARFSFGVMKMDALGRLENGLNCMGCSGLAGLARLDLFANRGASLIVGRTPARGSFSPARAARAALAFANRGAGLRLPRSAEKGLRGLGWAWPHTPQRGASGACPENVHLGHAHAAAPDARSLLDEDADAAAGAARFRAGVCARGGRELGSSVS